MKIFVLGIIPPNQDYVLNSLSLKSYHHEEPITPPRFPFRYSIRPGGGLNRCEGRLCESMGKIWRYRVA